MGSLPCLKVAGASRRDRDGSEVEVARSGPLVEAVVCVALSARNTLSLLAAVPIKALLKACEWQTVLHLGGGLCLRFLHRPRREGLLRR